jgi:hypothetical protein
MNSMQTIFKQPRHRQLRALRGDVTCCLFAGKSTRPI